MSKYDELSSSAWRILRGLEEELGREEGQIALLREAGDLAAMRPRQMRAGRLESALHAARALTIALWE